jgi:DNA modification methylase
MQALAQGDDTMVDVEYVELSEEKEKLALLILDKTSELATVDNASLEALMGDVQTAEQDLADLITEMSQEAGLLDGPGAGEVTEDEVPEPPVDPITKPGDLWLLGEHRVLCGDSTKAEDVERLMAGAKADLCFTSPPYSDQRTYTGEADLSPQTLSLFIKEAAAVTDFVCMNLGIARRGGFVDRYWDHYIATADQAGLGLLSWNVWYRTGGFSIGQVTAMFPIEHEFIFVFGRSPGQLVPTVPNANGGEKVCSTNRDATGKIGSKKKMQVRTHRELGTVLVSPPVNKNEEHPAQFPVSLPAEYIKAFSGNVYEPFCGSGTTLIAAEQLGRKCYGMEISPQYCDVIVKRWETLTGKKAILEKSV